MYSIDHVLEIIGEFELMGERHEEYLRHFKIWCAHASISFYEKMLEDPVRPIPFSERNLPTVAEFKAMVDKKREAKSGK